uniref:Uncharacterized protein n=1 Tax=Parascaris equorum TaxID=6256 RepID=A0A914SK95_PAREQ
MRSKGCSMMIASNHAVPSLVTTHVICPDERKNAKEIVLSVIEGTIGIGHPLSLLMFERALILMFCDS